MIYIAVCFQFLGIPPKGELNGSGSIGALGWMFPISRDPPEGGTVTIRERRKSIWCFQFLGIPPKGERLINNMDWTMEKVVSNF